MSKPKRNNMLDFEPGERLYVPGSYTKDGVRVPQAVPGEFYESRWAADDNGVERYVAVLTLIGGATQLIELNRVYKDPGEAVKQARRDMKKGY